MFASSAVAAVAGDRLFGKRWLFVLVQCFLDGQRLSRMTPKALCRNRSCEVRAAIGLVSRRHIPKAPLRVIRDWRLEQIAADVHQIAERVIPRADHIVDAELPNSAFP